MPLARLGAGVKHMTISVKPHGTGILTPRKVAVPNKIVKGKNVLPVIHRLLR